MRDPRHELEQAGDGHDAVPVEDESTKDLLRELIAESKHLLEEQMHLMRLEVQEIGEEGLRRFQRDVAIAKAEMKDEVRAAARAGEVIGAGGLLAHAGLYLALFAGVFALGLIMPYWLASLIVAAVAAAGGLLLVASGVQRIKQVRLVPRRTVQQLQEDRLWMKERSRALKSTVRASA